MSTPASTSGKIVPMPAWSNITGCARAIVAVLVLAFTAAAAGIWGGDFPAFDIALFTASATLIIFAYYFVALSRKPSLYNRWAILGLEVFGVLFWLVSFALLARWTAFYNKFWFGNAEAYGFWHAPFRPSDIGLGPDMGLRPRNIVKRASNMHHAGVALAGTAAGLAALEFVLYTVTLVVFSLSLHKERVAESNFARPINPPTNPPAQPTVDQTEKPEEATEDKPEPVSV